MNVTTLLDSRVARKKFAHAVAELYAAGPKYAGMWRLKKAEFPMILIEVMSASGKPAVILYLDMKNYDFKAPAATLLGLDFRQLRDGEVPAATTQDDGLGHIFASSDSPLWFCNPGFYEYHKLYPEDPWEMMRHTPQGKIVWIVERACSLINRQKLNATK